MQVDNNCTDSNTGRKIIAGLLIFSVVQILSFAFFYVSASIYDSLDLPHTIAGEKFGTWILLVTLLFDLSAVIFLIARMWNPDRRLAVSMLAIGILSIFGILALGYFILQGLRL